MYTYRIFGGDIIKVSFIGAGKVGFTLGKYFKSKGISLAGYYSKNINSAIEASNYTDSQYYSTIKQCIDNSDCIFITTPDGVISEIWQEILNYEIKAKIICHTSGALSTLIFRQSDQLGVDVYSIHPMYPFASKYESYKNLNQATFSIEGKGRRKNEILKLMQKLGNFYFELDSNKKSLYHLAAVNVSNLFIGLFNNSISYLQHLGLDEEKSIMTLKPLVEENIKNIFNNGIKESLTGPIERGDIDTIKRHLEVIPNEDLIIYLELCKSILKIAKIKNSNKSYSNIEDLLKGCKI